MRWIYARWRETTQRWEWCPAPRIDGILRWGRSYETQEAAFEAAQETIQRHATVTRVGTLTLRGACERAVAKLLADGGSKYTAAGYRARFGRWYEIIAADAPLTAITAGRRLRTWRCRRC
jgi:hypothetical protein